KDWIEDEKEEYQLTVDVYNKPEEIIIHTMVAGVRPEDLDISITREMVSMRGERKEPEDVATEDYYHKELYWGSFSRTIMLPAEIEVEEAEAIENHGLLSIRLPKIDKERQTKLKVKTRS
ncbi:Hsp20/alpha crystallin family protein, partial [Patescibacteria group bacterium]|nr:Hsp20/alpha crystallin family protein [Patescibacteria group bacterium]